MIKDLDKCNYLYTEKMYIDDMTSLANDVIAYLTTDMQLDERASIEDAIEYYCSNIHTQHTARMIEQYMYSFNTEESVLKLRLVLHLLEQVKKGNLK